MLCNTLLEPVDGPEWAAAGDKPDMTTAPGYLQCHRVTQFGRKWQCGFGTKRVVLCLEQQGWYGDVP